MINDYLELNKDNNKIYGFGSKLTSGIHYTVYQGHCDNDIFIKTAPEYKIKVIGIAIALIGILIGLLNILF